MAEATRATTDEGTVGETGAAATDLTGWALAPVDWLKQSGRREGEGMALPLVLVPPSKSMQPGGRGRVRPGSGAFRRLGPARRALVEGLAKALADQPDRAPGWFGAQGELLDRANAAFDRLATWDAPALPAALRYTGVVWDHLDPGSLPVDALGRLVVPSAVMGMSTGDDPVPDHRLVFSVSIPPLGRLDRWWRPRLTDALVAHAAGRPVVDMLPQEHAAALDLVEVGRHTQVVAVRFVAAGGQRAAGHAAKAVKGIAARTVLVDGVDALATLRWEGWRAQRVGDEIHVVGSA